MSDALTSKEPSTSLAASGGSAHSAGTPLPMAGHFEWAVRGFLQMKYLPVNDLRTIAMDGAIADRAFSALE